MNKIKNRRQFLQKLGLISLATSTGAALPMATFGQLDENTFGFKQGSANLKIFNGRVITPYRILSQGTVVVKEGKIAEVTDKNIEVPGAIEIDAKGQYITPGFVDLHVHGGGGNSFLDGTVDAFLKVAEAHARHGTTSLYPTAVSGELEELYKNLDVFEQASKDNEFGAQMLGVFLEGPYYSMDNRGAQDPRYIRDPDPKEYMEILSRTSAIKRWDSAPERQGALEFARYIRSKGVLPSMGHTSAVYEDVMVAFENGYTLATHLYSGMAGVTRRDSFRFAGGVESAYLIDEMSVEMIADGKHLPASLLKLIYQTKGADKIAMVTDAMRAAGTSDTESILGSREKGLEVIIYNGVAMLPDKSSFAGSVATADRLVRTVRELAEVPITDAVRMMTITPANIMGVSDRKGSLVPGKDADILIFDEDIQIDKTIIKGKIIYNKG
ncbi:MAG TPA: N-acetylglucosamine-6-phosphate deacetylase [Cyclobacteriaceae bacterium]|nr:N-acetylglucosamine-6-phosphate deacetylase [Cyclobacteriaceae bacterium]